MIQFLLVPLKLENEYCITFYPKEFYMIMDSSQIISGNDSMNFNWTNETIETSVVIGSVQNVTVHMLDSGIKVEAIGPTTIGDIGFAFCFLLLLVVTYLFKRFFPKATVAEQDLEQNNLDQGLNQDLD